jgi:hypothetical protein
MLEVRSNQKNLFAQNAAIFLFKTVPNMVKTLLNLNASSVAVLLNGFAGAILIFVNLAIRGSATEIMSANTQNSSCLNVAVLEFVRLVGTIRGTDRRKCLAVLFAGTTRKIINNFDLDRNAYYILHNH